MKKEHLTLGGGASAPHASLSPQVRHCMKPGLKVVLSLIFRIIPLRVRLSRQGGWLAILVLNDINFETIDTCSTINTDNEAITIFLTSTQDSISILTIYISPASSINTTLIRNIKKTADNLIITGDLNTKHNEFNCTKTGRWGMALKKALYNADFFIVDNSIPTLRDSRTNNSDIIDYIISSAVIFNKIQNLTLNNDLSSDHSAFLFDFVNKLQQNYFTSHYVIKLIGTQLTFLSLINLLSYRIRFLTYIFWKRWSYQYYQYYQHYSEYLQHSSWENY